MNIEAGLAVAAIILSGTGFWGILCRRWWGIVAVPAVVLNAREVGFFWSITSRAEGLAQHLFNGQIVSFCILIAALLVAVVWRIRH